VLLRVCATPIGRLLTRSGRGIICLDFANVSASYLSLGPRLLFLVTLILLLYSGPAARAQERIAEIPYPAAESFIDVERETILPYFNKLLLKPNTYTQLSFVLWERLAEERQRDLEVKGFNKSDFQRRLTGATALLAENEIRQADGKTIELLVDQNERTILYAIAMANYDDGIGLIVDFAPLPFKAYFTPVRGDYLRVFTFSSDRIFWDKDYPELDATQARIGDLAYYFALLDVAIRGDFSLATKLPLYEQGRLVDSIAISIAEYYPRTANRIPEIRTAYVVFNAMLAEFYHYDVKQIVVDDDARSRPVLGGYAGPRIRQGPAQVLRFYDHANFSPWYRALDERVITQFIRSAHPYEFSAVAARLSYANSDNFFDMLAYLMAHPNAYDDAVRFNLRKILAAIPADVPLINWQLQKTITTWTRANSHPRASVPQHWPDSLISVPR
jgi:hypothetical protein